jgi:hypothetical protein
LEWLKEVEALGGVAGWADSVKGAVEVLKRWGAISARIKL